MGLKTALYKLLALSNDVNAIEQAAKHRSVKPLMRRVGRRIYGKLSGRLAARLFR